MPRLHAQARRRTIRRRTIRHSAWRTLNIVVGIATILHLAAFGIIMPSRANALDTTFLSPIANVQNSAGDSWTNPTNAYADGGGAATNNTGAQHRYSSFGFAVPAATINGIEVNVDAWSTVSAANILTEDFGTGSTSATVTGWTQSGAGTQVLTPGSGDDTASPDGGRFALIDGNGGYICRSINATGLTALQLSYYWRGDTDATSNNDNGVVEYKTSGACSDSSGWTSFQSQDDRVNSAWTTQVASALPVALNNTTFFLRFRTATSTTAKDFRVDGIALTGTPANASCQIGVDLSWDGGTTWTAEKTQTLTGTEATYTLGGVADTWGRTWTPAETTNGNFVARVHDIDPGASCVDAATTNLDWLRARVTYTAIATGTLELKKVWSGTPGTATLNIGSTVGASDVATTTVSTNGATGTKTVNVGTYYFSETGALANYTSSLVCTDNGQPVTPGVNTALTVSSGHVIICTYTNTRQTGTIELKKIWSGTLGTTSLNIGTSVAGNEVVSTAVSTNGTTGTQTVNTGSYYVSESGPLVDHSASLACTDNSQSVTPGANNSLTVVAGHVVICTYTNTRNTGTIELKKVWSGTPGTTTLTIGTTNGASDIASTAVSANGTTGSKTVNTGTYFAAETAIANFTSSALTCFNDANNNGVNDNETAVSVGTNNSVAVATNQHVICTFINTRDTSSLTLTKVVDAGSALASTFGFTISPDPNNVGTVHPTAAATGTYTFANLPTGSYTVTESSLAAGYHQVSTTCASVSVTKNVTATCTVHNAHDTGTIELKKVWSGTPGTTTLNIGTTIAGNDVAATPLSTNGTTGTQIVNTGTYYVSEFGSLADHSANLICTDNSQSVTPGANTSLTVAAGHAIICTYTNTRNTGTIELKKIWSGTPGTTTLTIGTTSGTSDIASTIVSANGTTGPKTVNTGTYFAAETATANFTPSALTCFNDANNNGTNDNEAAVSVGVNNSVVVATNQHVICTFTNTRDTGSLTLTKVVDTGVALASTFGFTITPDPNGVGTIHPTAAATGTYTFTNLPTGSYTVTESSLAAGYHQVSTTCTNVSVTKNVIATCSMHNAQDTGTIELKKVWSGTLGTTTLNIGTAAAGTDVAATSVSTNGTTGTKTVLIGTYYVSETALQNYSTNLVCTDNGQPITPGANNLVTVASGHAVICTFTNTRNTGTIEVQKVWVGTKGTTTLAIGTSAGGTQVYAQQIAVANGTTGPRTVDTGTYYLSETSLANYSSVLTCSQGVTIGVNNSITVGINQNIVCVFTNTRKTGTIELKKVWSGTPSTTTLNVGTTPGGNDVALKTVSANDTTGTTTVDTGTYYVSETAVTGYTSSIACDNGVIPGVNNSIQVGDGQHVVCTFTNTQNLTTITVNKIGASTVVAGANITYTINWSINGNTSGTNAVISDAIPANTKFVTADNGGTFAVGVVTWNLGTQPVGASGTVSVTLKVASPLSNGTGISNTATFDTDQTSPVNATVRTLVSSAPILSISKTNSVTTFVAPGATVTYTVVVTNAAAATDSAIDVNLTDVLPSGFTYSVGGGTAKTFALGTIVPGASVTTTYSALVSAAQTSGTYTNTATAKGTNTSNVTTTSNIEVRTPVVPTTTAPTPTAPTPTVTTPTPTVLGAQTSNPTLVVTKTVDDANAVGGQILNYTITVTNTGPGDATNVVVTDTLPKGLTFTDDGTMIKSWSIGSLIAGAGMTITAKVHVSTSAATGKYLNTAVATSTEIDPVSAQVAVQVTQPQVLALATSGVNETDYLIFSFGALLMVAGYSLVGRRLRSQR